MRGLVGWEKGVDKEKCVEAVDSTWPVENVEASQLCLSECVCVFFMSMLLANQSAD